MATTPVNPIDALHQQLITEMSALAKKHVTVSYVLVGVLILVLGLASLGGYLGLKSYEAQLSRAEATEAQYNQDRKEWAATLAAHDAERAQEAKAQQVVIKVVDTRDQAANQAIQQAVKPDATLQEDATSLYNAFKDVPAFGDSVPPTDAQHVLLSGPQAQQVAAYKIDRDRLSADFEDGKHYLALEQSKNDTLTQDNAQLTAQNTEANKVIAQYKKAAIKSKWRKILDGSEKGALVVLGAALGHYL